MRQVAIFDIDGTIARTSLLQQFVRVLVNRGKIGVGTAQEIDTFLHDFRQKISDDEFGPYMGKAVEKMFAGMSSPLTLEEYDDIIDGIVKTSLTNTYVYTRQLIQSLNRNNYFLIAISGSELRMVATYAKALGFDTWVGKVSYDHDGKKLAGTVQALPQSKDVILDAIINKYQLDLKGSIAIGDTTSDIPLLEKVDSPIVFNPNQALFKHAQEKDWMVIVERKDMVYGLEKDSGKYILTTTNV